MLSLQAVEIYDVFYQTKTKSEWLFRIRVITTNNRPPNISDLECALAHENCRESNEDIEITLEIVKDLHRQMFQKAITLNFNKLPRNIGDIVKSP